MEFYSDIKSVEQTSEQWSRRLIEKRKLEELRSREYIWVFNPINEIRDESIQEADFIMNNMYFTRGNDRLYIKRDDLWDEEKFESDDRSTLYMFHCCYMLFYLSSAYEKTGNVEYLQRGEEILFNWDTYYGEDYKTQFAWHDHAAALRLLNICNFFESWKKECWEEHKVKRMINIAEKHCEKLYDDEFYMEKHNHGFDQDVVLYVASSIFDIMDKSEGYKEKALNRLLKQTEYLFNDDGTFREHSPHYGLLFTTRVIQFLSFCESNGIEHEILNEMEEVAKNCMRFLKSASYDNGMLVNISDGEIMDLGRYFQEKCGNIESELVGEINHEILTDDSMVNKEEKVFPNGGVVSLSGGEKNHLLFYSGFHTRVHKHHDDLSVVLYSEGKQVLIDGGKYNYNYNTPERQYVISNYAHNTVCVDGQNSDIPRLDIGKSGIKQYYLGSEVSMASGCHGLYKNVVHKRNVIRLGDEGYLIIDNLDSIGEHSFHCSWNLGPKINQVVEKDGEVICIDEKRNKVRIRELTGKSYTKIFCGNKKPLRGWHSPKYSEFLPCNQIQFQKKGNGCRFATLINLSQREDIISDYYWGREKIGFTYRGNDYSIRVGERDSELYVNGEKLKLKEIKNEVLENHLEKFYSNKP